MRNGILDLVPALSDLLTAAMLANSLEIMSRLSFRPCCGGNNYLLVKNLS
jgi:hypothetical protein